VDHIIHLVIEDAIFAPGLYLMKGAIDKVRKESGIALQLFLHIEESLGMNVI
jgi:hypothetical protein